MFGNSLIWEQNQILSFMKFLEGRKTMFCILRQFSPIFWMKRSVPRCTPSASNISSFLLPRSLTFEKHLKSFLWIPDPEFQDGFICGQWNNLGRGQWNKLFRRVFLGGNVKAGLSVGWGLEYTRKSHWDGDKRTTAEKKEWHPSNSSQTWNPTKF